MGVSEADKTRYRSIRLMSKCEHCGMPLPLMGPIREPTCTHCLESCPQPEDFWHEVIEQADSSPHRNEVWTCEIDVEEVSEVPAELEATGVDAPQWLRSLVPSIRRLFGAQDESSASAPAPEVADAPRPVVMSCPNCSGSLSITTKNERTTTCQYCQTDIYLPDDLWRRLHPVKKATRWYVEYEGESAYARRRRLDEERRREERRAAARERRPGEIERAVQKLEQRWQSSRSGFVVPIAFMLFVLVPMLNFLLFEHWGGSTGAYKWPGAGFICSRVCDGCDGPYKPHLEFSRDKPQYRYCQSPKGRPVKVPLGLYALAGTMPGFLLALLLSVVGFVVYRIKVRPERARLARRIADLRAEYKSLTGRRYR